MAKTHTWLEYCVCCGRHHVVTMQTCPSCQTYATPQPVGEWTADHCSKDYACYGCLAFREHQYA